MPRSHRRAWCADGQAVERAIELLVGDRPFVLDGHGWEGHPPETVQDLLDNIAKLRNDGLDVIED